MSEDRPKLIITEEDIANAQPKSFLYTDENGHIRYDPQVHQELVNSETDLSDVNTTHLFDREEFKSFISENFPQHNSTINSAARPQISSQPDELELWETARILKRKDRMLAENNWHYLARVLYEETFSVNQEPRMDGRSPLKKGIPGMTPGGLISHFYLRGINQRRTQELLTPKLAYVSLKDLLLDTFQIYEQPRDLYDAITTVIYITYPIQSSGFGRPDAHRLIHHQRRHPDKDRYSPDLESIGLRTLQMLSVYPSMTSKIQDPHLRSIISDKESYDPNKVDFIQDLWLHFGGILDEQARFKSEKDTGVKKLIGQMLEVRTHPEVQEFYEYLSPSGYINDYLKTNPSISD